MNVSASSVFLTAFTLVASAVSGERSARLAPATLARFDAVSAYCASIDPGASADYQARLATLLSEQRTPRTTPLRASAAYARAWHQATDMLAQVSLRSGTRGCAAFLSGEE